MFVSELESWGVGLVTLALDLSFGGWAEDILFVSGLGSWGVGLVTPALDLSFGSWACGPASFLNGNYVCSWTWKQGHWTCHLSIGLVCLRLCLRRSFILNKKLCLFLDLEAGLVTPALDLSF